jgi:LuxR family transcriptional regulator, maltose regulon positive regulatory protein
VLLEHRPEVEYVWEVSQLSISSNSLVSTKLRSSQVRPKLIARPRLTEKLEREVGRELTLISAPAGFGKTTLLVEWLRGRRGGEEAVAWLSLDEGDNDPTRFLFYLVAALGTVQEGIGEGVLSALRSPEPPRMEPVLGALINELADLPGEAVVVLDDYHVIDSEAVHGILSFLLEHLPPNVHLVISSRIDPPLPLSRLRARNQVMELGASDLSFTSEEAAAFLNSLMGLNLSVDDVAALEERTEGWIAGLQLAALSMKNRKDVSGFIKAFSGSHRDVLDYLAEEVLRRQPERVQEFLLETSILDHLSGALCDALTGSSNGQEMLERLERDNLFVVALDDERRWYRYHHLFADFLRARLHTENPKRIKELHCRAAAWCEQSGLASEAVGHALAADDYKRAADLVEQVIGEMWFRGEVMTILGWLEALPDEAKRHRPRLLLEHATALMWVGRLEDVESHVREAERIVDAAAESSGEGLPPNEENIHRRYLLGYAAATRAWHANLMGNPQGGIEFARRALKLLPDDPRPRTFAAFSLAAAYSFAGDFEAASSAFAKAAELGLAAGHDYLTLEAMGYHAELQMARGRLREAEGILRRALEFAAERGDVSLPATGEVQVAMGELLYEWDDLDSAEDRLMEGVRLAERTGQLGSLVDGYVSLSRLKQAQGDTDGALEAAREAERLARNSGVGQFIVEAAAWKSRLHLAQGELAAATSELERVGVGDGDPTFVREIEQLARARLLVARGKQDEALRLLADLREAAQAAGRTGREIEILTLQALTLQAMGKKERAVNTLTQALALGEPEGYVRTFVDEGPKMAALMSEVLEAQQRGQLYPPNRVSVHYLRRLRTTLEQEASDLASPSAELPEPLSERELEVLTLIAAGKTNQEIAGELFVAKSTVKTHIKNIYLKLDVRNRTQAVSRARKLGLL